MGIGGIVSLDEDNPVALRLKRCLESLDNCSGKVLEIGCGAGRMVKNLKYHCPALEIYGCDISFQAIHTASQKMPKENFTVADVQHLPYAEHSFDIVVGFDIVEHVTDVQQTIVETYRVLKTGGLFHLHAPCEGNPFTIYWFLAKIGIAKDLKRRHAGHIQKLTSKSVLASLRNQGYDIVNISYSWHFIGQLSDLTQYLFRGIQPRLNDESLSQLTGIRKIFAKAIDISEHFLTIFSIREDRVLRNFPWAMGIHITARR